jgi:iron complex outermembrane recepter protein
MKRITTLIILLCIVLTIEASTNTNPTNKTSFSGTVTDKKNAEPLPGVAIYFPDLKTGGVTDEEGKFRIENLPASKLLVQISMVGYRTIIENVDLSTVTDKSYEMEYTATEINEVVVTGTSGASDVRHLASPVEIVSKSILLQNASTNIIDAIARQPGISQLTTGSGISKPVIRGLGYNRVVVMNDGVRQEGQQWGDEHGIEIDEYGVDKVEILKGPASLSYGSDAMAGVINLLPAQALSDGKIAGSLVSNYQTNNGLVGYSADITGNTKGFVWDVRYSSKLAHAYQNKYDGFVYNSGFRENAFSAMAGINKSWGYSRLTISSYYLMPGLVEGERDSLTGKFIKPVALNDTTEGSAIATNKDFRTYSPRIPYQRIHHYKIVSKSSFIIGKGNLKTTFGFQQNRRQEFGDILASDEYGLYFLLNTLTYDVQYLFPELTGFGFTFGINGMQQNSRNKGTEFLVPEYSLFDAGIFCTARINYGKFDFAGGVRYDTRFENGQSLFLNENEKIANPSDANAIQRFKAFSSTFTGISGSIGTTWQITQIFFTKLNLSRGFRAPNIAELASNGVHEGTIRYELGDSKLKPENSLQFDYSFGINSEHISAELNLFDNHIDNFIFLHKLAATQGGDSLREGLGTFKFVSGNAHLYGGEIHFDIHPHPFDWIHFENTFSVVQAIQTGQPDSTKYLPFTPASSFLTILRFDIKQTGKHIRNAYFQVGDDYYFARNKVYEAYQTETKTPAYILINSGLGTDFIGNKTTLFSFFISVENITNVAYQSHLSRLKYGSENYNTGRTGVYNMGRNISFKLIVPIRL